MYDRVYIRPLNFTTASFNYCHSTELNGGGFYELNIEQAALRRIFQHTLTERHHNEQEILSVQTVHVQR